MVIPVNVQTARNAHRCDASFAPKTMRARSATAAGSDQIARDIIWRAMYSPWRNASATMVRVGLAPPDDEN
jgi:hypothetical protein